MAAVAAEPGAAAVPTTTITSATDDEGPREPGPADPGLPGALVDTDEPREYGPAVESVVPRVEDGGDGEERRHVGPELEPAAGKALSDNTINDELLSNFPTDRISLDRFSPGALGDPEGGGNVSVQAVYRSILADPQPSAVFLHSFPAPPPVTEAGLSLAEPAEPTTNVTTDRAETADRDRGYTALVQPELRPGPAEDAMLDGTAERLSVPHSVDPDSGFGKNSAGNEELSGRGLRDSSPPCRSPKRRLMTDSLKQEKPAGEDSSRPEPGPEPGFGAPPLASVQDLSPGSEVRVSLDHVIDDALVVSFRLGEKLFSGVLMDVSKRFGPYGIPITVFPRRDDRSRPQMSVQSQPVAGDDPSAKQEEVTVSPSSPPPLHPHPWTSKPPPLFQEGAPYPPPLFIRDTYNQALPQPLPRKIKRPKRRYRCEEPTSIMNAIKLRPRQVLCDKCKGVVASGGHRDTRRGPVDLRGEEASRRRRPADGPISSEVKRLRSDDKAGRTVADRRSASGIRVSSSSSSSSSRRVLRGVASSSSSSPSSSNRMCLKLNSKKVLAKGSAVDRSKARQVLKKLARSSQPSPPPAHRRPKDQNQNQNQDQTHNQDRTKAVTRAAALQNHNQKVHYTRRQHLSGAAVSSSSHTPLPPRMRLKPQRYRTDDSQAPCSSSSSSPPTKQSACSSPPKPSLSPVLTPESSTAPSPPSTTAPPPALHSCAASVAVEIQEVSTPEEEGTEQGKGGDDGQVMDPPPRSSSLDSSHSECSSTETFDLPPHGDAPSSSPPTPPPSSLGPRCPSSSSPSTPPPRADDEELQAGGEEEEGGELKRRRKSSTSSSSSSSSSSSVFSKLVSKCLLPDGRTVCVGDIVWAKIYGFPWWPARVLGITVSRRGDTGLAVRQEARVSWFGSPTTSFLPLTQLSPFLESFQSRFDRKRKGPYRRAIAEAASAAKQLTPEVRALLTQFET
ncbi:PWWP domain-containing protein 2A [Chelmon rostratus]|uniref:PWWP domain-containing protein 2A n=1 Tax=Chelmon rostratus TaxID=109905 RepID=UPI001BE920CC|nr:PWWP domain-containing protein 2A [Chelmon rostratus]